MSNTSEQQYIHVYGARWNRRNARLLEFLNAYNVAYELHDPVFSEAAGAAIQTMSRIDKHTERTVRIYFLLSTPDGTELRGALRNPNTHTLRRMLIHQHVLPVSSYPKPLAI